ncbi:MAG TPA: TatD family deoxyribonuclease [Fervidicoccus fontis]|uniref:TatD family deoxyribonuclease n=1 Tax=Fervidicoccus fontis TaxID=683846 RepID=A0A7C2Z3W3_9CREN|nr:MAG: TatD family deoxyribonuclease [Fervidicoccus sp.]HEU97641.1 TatD family deoxyribonuclease [Fervidicoccus fontis]
MDKKHDLKTNQRDTVMASVKMTKYVDSHAHAYEYDEAYISGLKDSYIIISVSDDLESSKRTLMLAKEHDFLKPCIGIHPWRIEDANREALKEIEKLLDKMDIPCIGEVGLDRKFVPQTFELQLRVFGTFLTLAKETDAILNLHAAGAWDDVANLVLKHDVTKAIFHWFTGSKETMQKLQEAGFYISFNVAAIIQKKHADLLHFADLRRVLTESDGPYEYRGEKLTTDRIPQLIDFMSTKLKIDRSILLSYIQENVMSFFR